ncbi:MAG TPA: TonB-dependent receptor [Allosphingosinicella sp.]|nr:TonB-dependent receptor [Allosphingosinicella sp.]
MKRLGMNPRRRGTALGLVLVAAHCGGLGAGAAWAQAPSTANEDRVEEIVVTANKRSENIQKVPIAITAVTGKRLEDVGITSTQDLAQVVPGLTIQNSLSGTQAHLRGVGTTALSAGTENSVATYVDGVYIISLSGALVQLNNIEQVEVLKGPQGTLFGRNATGGVINIRTRDPKHEPSGDFNLRYGNYETFAGQGYLTAGLTDSLAADIAGFVSLQGKGWGKNLFSGKDANRMDQYAVRSKWLFEPGDSDEFRLIGDYSVLKGNSFNSFSLLEGTYDNYGPGNVTAADRAARVGPGGLPTPDALAFQSHIATWLATQGGAGLAPFAVVGDPFPSTGGFYDINVFNDPKYLYKTGGVSLQWDHHFGDSLKMTSITAYRRSRQHINWDSVPVPAFRGNVDWDEKESQFSQELQLGSAAGSNIQWVVGLYYLKGKADYLHFDITGTPFAPLEKLQFHSFTHVESGAAFGQVTAPLWEGAHVTGGLRYTIEEHGVKGDTVLWFPGGVSVVLPAQPQKNTWRKLTWRVALDQQLTPDILGYLSYNRGFKSGLYNSIPPGGDAIDPEVLDAYEVGLKTQLADGRLRFNIAAFYYKYTNLQVTVFTSTSALLQNGAGAEVYGTDFDFTGRIGPNLTVYGGASLMHSEFTSYPGAGFFALQPLEAGGGTVQTVGDAKGNKLPYAPDFSFNLGATYSVPLASGKLELNANYSYQGRWYNNGDNLLSQPGYGLLDGSINYEFGDTGFRVGIWGRNIASKKYYVFLASQANPGGHQQGLPGAPRTFGAMVGYKF